MAAAHGPSSAGVSPERFLSRMKSQAFEASATALKTSFLSFFKTIIILDLCALDLVVFTVVYNCSDF